MDSGNTVLNFFKRIGGGIIMENKFMFELFTNAMIHGSKELLIHLIPLLILSSVCYFLVLGIKKLINA